jgi:hypothetical protein
VAQPNLACWDRAAAAGVVPFSWVAAAVLVVVADARVAAVAAQSGALLDAGVVVAQLWALAAVAGWPQDEQQGAVVVVALPLVVVAAVVRVALQAVAVPAPLAVAAQDALLGAVVVQDAQLGVAAVEAVSRVAVAARQAAMA